MFYKTPILAFNSTKLIKKNELYHRDNNTKTLYFFRQNLLLTSLFTLSLTSLFQTAYAYNVVVSSTSDTTGAVQTSLRDAILAANASTDTTINISFNSALSGNTILLNSALPMISNYVNNGASVSLANKTWNITGPTGGITIDGNINKYRGLFLSPIPDPAVLVPATGQPTTDIDATTYPRSLSVNLENITLQNTLAQGGNVSFNGEGGGFGGGGLGPNSDGNGFAGGGLGGNNNFINSTDKGGGGLGGDSNDTDGTSGGVWGSNGNGIGQLQSAFTAPGFSGGTSAATSSPTNGGIGGGGALATGNINFNTNASNGGFGGGGGNSSGFDNGPTSTTPLITVNASNGGFGGGGGLSSSYSLLGNRVSLTNVANGGFGGGGGNSNTSTGTSTIGSSTISNSSNGGFGGGGGTAGNTSNAPPFLGRNSDISTSCQGGFGGGAGQINNSGGAGGGAGLGGAIFVNSGVNLSLKNVNLIGNKAIGGNANASGSGGGGGGAGMGGGIFVRAGANITFLGSLNFQGSQVIAGSSKFNNGSAFGSGIFLQGNSNATNNNNGITSFTTFNPGFGLTQTINDDIADQTGNGGTGSNAGSWAIQKTGQGLLVLKGTNTYSGGTLITGGLINFARTANFGTGNITLNGGGIQWDLGNQIDISGKLNPIGAAGGTFDTNGNNVNFASILSGAGGLIKQGTGTATFAGANTYSGLTQINAGILTLASAGTIAQSSGVGLVAGATFDISAGNQTIQDLTGTGGTVNLATSTLTFGSSRVTTFSGLIQGTGGLIKQGTGTATFAGANTYSGLTQINAGTLALASAGTIAQSSGVGLVAGATFDISAGNQTIQDLTGTGGTVNLATSTLTFGSSRVTTFSGLIQGTGGLIKQGTGTATFAGANTYSGLTQINAGTLALASAGTIAQSSGVGLVTGATFDISAGNQTIQDLTGTGGTVNLATSTLTFGSSRATTFSGLIQGTGGLIKQGTGTATFAGANTYSGLTQINAGTLILQNAAAAGSSTIINNATLGLSFSNATFNNNLSGSGVTNLTGSNVILSGASSGFSGSWIISGSASVTSPINLGSASVNLTSSASQLNIQALPGAGYTFANLLKGTGTLKAIMGTKTDAFNFGPNTGSAFTGIIELGAGTFSLANTNTVPLTNATLQLDTGNTTTVGNSTQNIGNLIMNGGALVFSTSVPANRISAATINTTNLSLTGGQVRLTVPNASEPPTDWSGPTSTNPLLQQDEITLVQLINATSVTGLASNLTLIDQNGNSIINGENVNLTQNGTPVAVGMYGYGLTTKNNTGLYVSYGLLKLTLQQNQILLLSGDNATPTGSELHALLTGSGNISVDATNTITINNANNDFTGTTTVIRDVLILGTDNALGKTSALTIQAGATTNINGKSQTVGALNAIGTLNIANGNLTISNGGTTSAGMLVGGGFIQLTGGNLAINGANPQLSALPTIAINASATLNDVNGLGTAPITSQGTLIFDNASGQFNNDVVGAGAVNITNNSNILLSGTRVYTGPTNINSSALVLNGKLINSPTNVGAGSILSGNATVYSLKSSGITSPGNSIGIIESLTTLDWDSNHVYKCEVDDSGHSDLVVVGGTATLNGTLQIVPLPGNYQNGNSYIYTLLTSGNLITTNFPTVTGLAALLGYQVIYQPNAVLLEITKKNISLVGFQGNAGRVADALANLKTPTGALQTTLNNFNTLTFNQLNDALNTLDTANNAPIQNSLANNFFDLWGPLIHTLHDPLERSKPHSFFTDLVANVTASVKSTLIQLFPPASKQKARNKGFNVLPNQTSLPDYFRSVIGQSSFWINNSIKSLNQKTYYHPGTTVPEVNTTTAGTQVGLDYQLTADLLVGLTTGYAHTSYHLSNNYGRGDVKTYQLGAYGSFHVTPEWYMDAFVSYGFNDFHGSRIISYPQFTATATQKHRGNQFGSLIETGYDIALPCSFTLTPMVNTGLVYLHESGYTETGADTLGLAVKSQGRTYFQGKAGAQLAKFLIEGDTQLYGFIKLAYTYRKGLRNADRTTSSFINQPAKFTVFSHNHPDNLASPGAGFTALFKNDIYITLGYNGDFGKNLRAHEGFLKLGKKF